MHGSQQAATIVEAIEDAIVSGGDERLTLDADGRNKYHLDPRSSIGTFHRGSCTCSPLNAFGAGAVAATHDALASNAVAHSTIADRQRERLLALFVPDAPGAGVVFAPSGSDLCYLPSMFSSVIEPGRRIVNVVATSEELGSGSLLAHEGRLFAEQTQVRGGLTIGTPLDTGLDVETVLLPARDEWGGIVDQGAAIERVVAERDPADALIVNLVIGSKSGIENGVSVIERFAGEEIIWTVDLCQMRARPALYERLLGLGCMLLCTGSKFYEAPPFCGAMLVPPAWMDRLAGAHSPAPAGYGDVFARADFPDSLKRIAEPFPVVHNTGLRLRWEAALAEIEAFDAVPRADSAAAIAAWHATVVDRIDSSETLELLRDQELTNDSIVSFRIRDAVGGHLDRAALAAVHRSLAIDGAPEIAPFRRATIGQPVSYTSGSFLRVAIGSSDVRRAVAAGYDPAMDLALMAALERTAQDLS
ncbi:MAG: hypothetical protein AB8G26_10395 [Ilumatobacter sp.]